MEKQIYLTIPFDTFMSSLNELISEGESLHKSNISTEEELTTFKEKSTDWVNRSHTVLQNSFNEPLNNYANEFNNVNPSFFSIPGIKKTLKQEADKQKEIIALKQTSLWNSLRILTVSDIIISPDKVDRKQREQYKIEEKLNLLLEKLYILYDDHYYSVKEILEGNGIIFKRHNEDRELAEILEAKGYIKLLGLGKGVGVQLTTEGAMYVENNCKPVKENYGDIHQTPEELEKKLDEIFEKLTFLGYGQEIIFDELQELKNLYTKLSKKTWGQVLKGKLIDLALGKLVDTDTIKYIYEALTDHKLHLP